MSELETIAARNNVPVDAAEHVLEALVRGHGRMAQFNHPALGGMGQWTAGGMTMVGDMFNTSLQARVASLCTDLQPLVAQHATSGEGQSGSGAWWPHEFGQPATAGSQNDSQYAFFPEARRLALKSGDRVTVYDTGEHRIGGVSQQQGPGSDLSFTSQLGPVRLHDLRVVRAPADGHATPQAQGAPRPLHEQSAPARAPSSPQAAHGHGTPVAPSPRGGSSHSHDVLTTLERLSELRQKGVLTDDEFTAKKAELLQRL